jgi:hypothetical protein
MPRPSAAAQPLLEFDCVLSPPHAITSPLRALVDKRMRSRLWSGSSFERAIQKGLINAHLILSAVRTHPLPPRILPAPKALQNPYKIPVAINERIVSASSSKRCSLSATVSLNLTKS